MITLLSIGCGHTRETGAFEEYVQKFETYSNQQYGFTLHVNDIIIKFAPLDSSKLGVCTHGLGTPQITINPDTWNSLSNSVKEILLLHELGHCVLNRDHNNTKRSDRIWESLMSQWPQEVDDYNQHKEDYIRELFKPAK